MLSRIDAGTGELLSGWFGQPEATGLPHNTNVRQGSSPRWRGGPC
jgi:hypothetical protein